MVISLLHKTIDSFPLATWPYPSARSQQQRRGRGQEPPPLEALHECSMPTVKDEEANEMGYLGTTEETGSIRLGDC
jgi:hypothetical protein